MSFFQGPSGEDQRLVRTIGLMAAIIQLQSGRVGRRGKMTA
jgi:hypothetical protein